VIKRLEIESLDQADPSEYSSDIRKYFSHYNLDAADDVEHLFGTFESGGFTLATHLYKPANYAATVILLHGYLNHSGQFKHLIAHLLENGYAVSVYDMPGHGLSSGESAAIDSFDQYEHITQDFMEVVQSRLAGPYYAIGFSTGAAVLTEMLLENKADDFDKIVMAAPLIHWAAYDETKATYRLYNSFTDRVARFHRKNSSDKDYLIFNKKRDYLHCNTLSLKWVKALFDWNDKIDLMGPCDKEVLVIQGDKDGTVDWKYNVKLIQEKFPNSRLEMIPGANHELFNEAKKYKEKALSFIGDYLKDK
jgi:lysophospholipase